VGAAQKQICAIAEKKVEIVSVNIWGRAYRAIKNGLRSVNGVGTIAFDVVAAGAGTPATGGAAAPYAVGLAVVSVAGGMATIMSVGEERGGFGRPLILTGGYDGHRSGIEE
jgi:hypothetical protein